MPRLLLLTLALVAGPVAPVQTADLDVDKRADTPEVEIGDEATFFIAVTNGGPDAADNVVIEEALPDGLAFAAARPTRGTYDPAAGTWTLGTLRMGETAILEIAAVLVADTPVENCAGVQASGSEDEATANNSSCAVVRPKYVRPKREKLDPVATLLR